MHKPNQRLVDHFSALRRQVEAGGAGAAPKVEGRLRRIVGTLLEAEGCKAPIGAYCIVETTDGDWLETEVVGFASDHILLMPTGELRGVMPHARVLPIAKGSSVE
ncbi:MAG: flagellum-specific ATP synthase FliI, partial [Spongiibacter sp.]|nr:flagellum-specific ATP synthase FliI [Spongiibacter sp.]